MKASEIRLVVMTVDRPQGYVHSTLASLFASDPLAHELAGIHLMVGSTEASYLGCYRHHCRLHVHPLDGREWEGVRGWGVHRRFCHNYHRCLTIPMGEANGLCVCEDDVVVRDGFVSKLLETVEEMERGHGLYRYLLACYVPYRLADDLSLRRGRRFASYPAWEFYGTQCVYYPRAVLGEMAGWVLRDGVERPRQPGDLIVKDYGASINGIYGTVRSLVQHVGRHSTGLGHFHAAPTFDEPFPDVDT